MSPDPKASPSRSFDYERAKQLLAEVFAEAEADFQAGTTPPVAPLLIPHFDLLFASSTQSLREGFLGCVIARMIDPKLNIRHPYVSQSDDAFSGRTVDEQVVNPLLQDRRVPCSRGPYLATFRRDFTYTADKAKGYRDKRGFGALLALVGEVERLTTDDELKSMLTYLLYRFVVLREAANVPLSRIHRLSMDQYESLIGGLLQVPSGGLLPVLLTVATFEALRQSFDANWELDWQGINVADRASSAGGDVTIRRPQGGVLAIEVTERQVDANRIVSTFNAKIAPNGIEDYLFFFTDAEPTSEAREVASKYFAQGHEISFLQIKPWMIHLLGILGPKGRSLFNAEFLKLLDTRAVPAAIKVAWNDRIKALLGS